MTEYDTFFTIDGNDLAGRLLAEIQSLNLLLEFPALQIQYIRNACHTHNMSGGVFLVHLAASVDDQSPPQLQ